MTAGRRIPVGGRRAVTACGRAAAAGWRAAIQAADRIWYGRPGVLMTAYVVLIAASRLIAHSAGRSSRQAGLEVTVLVLLIWCWRVSRGGYLSRGLLLLTTIYALSAATAHLASWWDGAGAAVLVISAVQLALLLSPAAYLATRRDPDGLARPDRQQLVPVAGGPARLPWCEPVRTALTLRLRPRWWLLPAALGLGLIVTAALLATSHYLTFPGCAPPGLRPGRLQPARCLGYGRGYPLPVWTDRPSPQQSARAAFGRDCAQWAVASLAVLHGSWLAARARAGDLPVSQPAGLRAG